MGDEDLLGDCWSLVRPRPDTLTESTQIDSLVPRAEWFWSSVQRLCVPECCGLDAYDFSAASVAWACGWGAERPGRDANGWRCEHPGDPHALAGRGRRPRRSAPSTPRQSMRVCSTCRRPPRRTRYGWRGSSSPMARISRSSWMGCCSHDSSWSGPVHMPTPTMGPPLTRTTSTVRCAIGPDSRSAT